MFVIRDQRTQRANEDQTNKPCHYPAVYVLGSWSSEHILDLFININSENVVFSRHQVHLITRTESEPTGHFNISSPTVTPSTIQHYTNKPAQLTGVQVQQWGTRIFSCSVRTKHQSEVWCEALLKTYTTCAATIPTQWIRQWTTPAVSEQLGKNYMAQETVLPLSVSIHQDPNQDSCDSHQDGIVVDTFQTCNTNTCLCSWSCTDDILQVRASHHPCSTTQRAVCKWSSLKGKSPNVHFDYCSDTETFTGVW